MTHCAHHGHQHSDESASSGWLNDTRRLAIALCVILSFGIIEVVGGILSGSLALLADAGHMGMDAAAIALALGARYFAKHEPTKAYPIGRRRAKVLAAFVNGVALLFLVGLLVWESGQRFFSPTPIVASTMLNIAIIGLGANIVAFLLLHAGDRHDINMRGALLHVIGDLLGSVAAIVSALVIMRTGFLAIDPIVTLVVCALIVRSAVPLVKDATHVLLQGAPSDLDTEKLAKDMTARFADVVEVDLVRVWLLTPDQPQLTMTVRARPSNDTGPLLAKMKAYLVDVHHINDSIIQIETASSCIHAKEARAKAPLYACPEESLPKGAADTAKLH